MMTILVGTPTYDRRIDIDLFKTLMSVERTGKYDLDFIFPVSSHLSRNRNYCVKQALDKGHDWLLFLDSDISIDDAEFIDKMLETAFRFGAKVVCGAYRIKKEDLSMKYALAKKIGDARTQYDNLTEVKEPQLIDAGGTGIMLIHREVLQKMSDPHFTMIDGKDLFIFPEDWEFCRKAQELGFLIAVEPRFATKHYGSYGWSHTAN